MLNTTPYPKTHLRAVPGPQGISHFKHLFHIQQHYAEAYLNLYRQYGNLCKLTLPFRALLVFHPADVNTILKENVKNYRKSQIYDFIRPLLGQGLVTSEGELWKKQRRIVGPEFHLRKMDGFIQPMNEQISQLFEQWDQSISLDQNRNFAQDMATLTLRVVCDVLMGSDVREDTAVIAQALSVFLTETTQRMFSLLKSFPFLQPMAQIKIRRAVHDIHSVVEKIIQKRRREGILREDVLSRLIRASMQDNQSMTDQQLVDEISTMMIAGHETTANALCWVWILLNQHPAVYTRVREEVLEHVGTRTPVFSDLEHLVYTRCVLWEVLRLYPPVPVVSRNNIEEDMISGIKITPNTLLILSPYVTHRHTDFWRDPELFDPNRFLKTPVDQLPAVCFFPFLEGPRKCVGEFFAMSEAMLVLIRILQRYHVQVLHPHQIASEAKLALRPKHNQVIVKIAKMQHPTISSQSDHSATGPLRDQLKEKTGI